VDAICAEAGVWPHAVLSAHAHNYQRFTRIAGDRQTPYGHRRQRPEQADAQG